MNGAVQLFAIAYDRAYDSIQAGADNRSNRQGSDHAQFFSRTMVTLDTNVTDGTLGWMAACNIRNIDQSLLRRMKVAAAQNGLTLRDWAIRAFARELGDELVSDTNRERQGGASVLAKSKTKTLNKDNAEGGQAGVEGGNPIRHTDDETRTAKVERRRAGMTAEEFMSLPISEQLRARREGKF